MVSMAVIMYSPGNVADAKGVILQGMYRFIFKNAKYYS